MLALPGFVSPIPNSVTTLGPPLHAPQVTTIELYAEAAGDIIVSNTTSNSTTEDDNPYAFLEVSLYVTNKPVGEAVTTADVIELVWQSAAYQVRLLAAQAGRELGCEGALCSRASRHWS